MEDGKFVKCCGENPKDLAERRALSLKYNDPMNSENNSAEDEIASSSKSSTPSDTYCIAPDTYNTDEDLQYSKIANYNKSMFSKSWEYYARENVEDVNKFFGLGSVFKDGSGEIHIGQDI